MLGSRNLGKVADGFVCKATAIKIDEAATDQDDGSAEKTTAVTYSCLGSALTDAGAACSVAFGGQPFQIGPMRIERTSAPNAHRGISRMRGCRRTLMLGCLMLML
jgi:hypothetical protein